MENKGSNLLSANKGNTVMLSDKPGDGLPEEIVNAMGLSLEQQFLLQSFKGQVKNASREQAIDLAISAYTLLLGKDAAYRRLLKQDT